LGETSCRACRVLVLVAENRRVCRFLGKHLNIACSDRGLYYGIRATQVQFLLGTH